MSVEERGRVSSLGSVLVFTFDVRGAAGWEAGGTIMGQKYTGAPGKLAKQQTPYPGPWSTPGQAGQAANALPWSLVYSWLLCAKLHGEEWFKVTSLADEDILFRSWNQSILCSFLQTQNMYLHPISRHPFPPTITRSEMDAPNNICCVGFHSLQMLSNILSHLIPGKKYNRNTMKLPFHRRNWGPERWNDLTKVSRPIFLTAFHLRVFHLALTTQSPKSNISTIV